MNTQRHNANQSRYRASGLYVGLLLGALTALGCAASVPKELNDARAAYQGASEGPAAESNPAQLHTARQSLKLAEKTFEEEGDSDRTRDRAYVAMRKAQLAETQARIMQTENQLLAMGEQAEKAQVTQLAQTKEQLEAAEQAKKEAEAKSAAAALELARLANVKQEARGMVITLSGSVLFASNKSELLPAAQRRLADVATALKQSGKDSQIVVEGHTDAKGSPDYNLELSAKRAEAVRNYLVSQGIPDNQIRAEGLGLSRPVADNKTAEGRANNRRVEIVVQPGS